MKQYIPEIIKSSFNAVKDMFVKQDPQKYYLEIVQKKQRERKNKGFTKALIKFSSHVQKQSVKNNQKPLLSKGQSSQRKIYAFDKFNQSEYDKTLGVFKNSFDQADNLLNISQTRNQKIKKLQKKIMIEQFNNKRISGSGFGYGFEEGRQNQIDNSRIVAYQDQINNLLHKSNNNEILTKKSKKKNKQFQKYQEKAKISFQIENPIRISLTNNETNNLRLRDIEDQCFSRQQQYNYYRSMIQFKNNNFQNKRQNKKSDFQEIINNIKKNLQYTTVISKKQATNLGYFQKGKIQYSSSYFNQISSLEDLLNQRNITNFTK